MCFLQGRAVGVAHPQDNDSYVLVVPEPTFRVPLLFPGGLVVLFRATLRFHALPAEVTNRDKYPFMFPKTYSHWIVIAREFKLPFRMVVSRVE